MSKGNEDQVIRVRAPSRLHFGLLSLPDGEEVVPARRFGGVGLMVEAPGLVLSVRPAPDWSAEGPLAERALAFARHFAGSVPPDTLVPQHVTVEHCPLEHTGLGTGTQLGLAIGRALAVAGGRGDLDAPELARRVARGARSALGIHGFARGGFLVDGGKRSPNAIAPLVARLDFPEEWRVVLVLRASEPGLHGIREGDAFARLAGQRDRTDRLCRLVLLGLLPALAEHDVEVFGEALHDFNSLAGEAFAPVQGGVYANPQIVEVVSFVRRLGVRGVGQSSWGPAVFAVVPCEEAAADLACRVREYFGLRSEEVMVTRACNRGSRAAFG